MPANIDPVYSSTGHFSAGGTSSTFAQPSNTANTSLTTGTVGTDMFVAVDAASANAPNGLFVRSLVVKYIGTSGASAASVMRFFINNSSTAATATNNALFKELTLPALTATNTAASPDFEVPCNILLPVNYRILYTFGTAPGATNLFICFGVCGRL